MHFLEEPPGRAKALTPFGFGHNFSLCCEKLSTCMAVNAPLNLPGAPLRGCKKLGAWEKACKASRGKGSQVCQTHNSTNASQSLKSALIVLDLGNISKRSSRQALAVASALYAPRPGILHNRKAERRRVRSAAEGPGFTDHWPVADNMASPSPVDREEIEREEARHPKRPRLDDQVDQEQIVRGTGFANRALRSVLKGGDFS